MDFKSEIIRKKVEQAMDSPFSDAVIADYEYRQEGYEPLIACSAGSVAVVLQEFGVLTGGKQATGEEIIGPHIIGDLSKEDARIVLGVALWRKAQAMEAPESTQDATIGVNDNSLKD